MLAKFEFCLGGIEFEIDRIGQQLGQGLTFLDAIPFVDGELHHASTDRASDRGPLLRQNRSDERLASPDFALNNARNDHWRLGWCRSAQSRQADDDDGNAQADALLHVATFEMNQV